jgi:hypothetical protein
MKERSISEEVMREAVLSPDRIITSFKGRKRQIKYLSRNTLEVVCFWENYHVIVITAYFI